ncbi:hypothetical protein LPJ66_010856 [Kickxella alabastrina]|uniref:Uncharacterized protein n=1 Tax=Kickxella alabastrina TaxID=61397 RepID=A0ACC1I3F5_9FUNG|nr:hypothetical protein LPJ66_010856 [Kickxella alabastrina]
MHPNFNPPSRPPRPPPLLSILSDEERFALEKMATAQVLNPSVVDMVRQTQRDNPKYRFLFADSPLHAVFQGIVQSKRQTTASDDPPPTRYHSTPAGLMVQALQANSHNPGTTLHARHIESLHCLHQNSPTDSPALNLALSEFLRGVRYIYREGEFVDRGNPLLVQGGEDVRMDREGWRAGVLERIVWGVRERMRQQRLAVESGDESSGDGSDSSSSSSPSPSSGDSDSGSDSDSSSSSSSSSSSAGSQEPKALPTHINRALGSSNLGFQMLAKLGWQQGQGLGATSNGILEPIRPPTRFSSIKPARNSHRRSRNTAASGSGSGRKQKAVARPSLGTGTVEYVAPLEEELAAEFESYRRKMSCAYRRTPTDAAAAAAGAGAGAGLGAKREAGRKHRKIGQSNRRNPG